MKNFILLGSLIFAQFSFAQVITGEEARAVREALTTEISGREVICKNIVGGSSKVTKDAIINVISRDLMVLSINEVGQPAISISQGSPTSDYKMTFDTSADHRSVNSITIKTHSISTVRTNVGTLLRPEFKTEQIKKLSFHVTCEVL